jgi:hypothetical protein
MKRTATTTLAATLCAVFGAMAISQAAQPQRVRSGRSLASHFAVIRSARLAGSALTASLPANTAESLTRPGTLVSGLELEPALASNVKLRGTKHSWVVPGRRGICLVLETAREIAQDCNETAAADSRGLVMIERRDAGTGIFGLVPNGASVSATNSDGAQLPIAVEGNVFSYEGNGIQSVSVRNGRGFVTTTPVN